MNVPEYRHAVRHAIDIHREATAEAQEAYRQATVLADDRLVAELNRIDDQFFEEQDKPVEAARERRISAADRER